MMVGFSSTDQYDNATVDNWPMTIDHTAGLRLCGGKVLCSSSAITWVPMPGGVGAYIERTATGLYTVVYERSFRKTPHPMVGTYEGTNYNWQAHVYEATGGGCKVMTSAYAGAAWALSSDVDWQIVVVGR